jgi:hypothetical protein
MAVLIRGSAGVTTNSGAVYNGLQTGTAVTASGTTVDFTDIPSWVKRITVMFGGVSSSGTSQFLVQIGTGGTPATSGYIGSMTVVFISSANNTGGTNATTGFIVAGGTAAATYNGSLIITNVNSNDWVAFGNSSAGSAGTYSAQSAGGVTLGGALNLVRFTTINGTDTFDAGTVNIIYE